MRRGFQVDVTELLGRGGRESGTQNPEHLGDSVIGRIPGGAISG